MTFFPLSWTLFSPQQQRQLTQSLSHFLACDIHYNNQGSTAIFSWEELDREHKQWGNEGSLPFCTQTTSPYSTIPITGSIEALLESILRCQPQPRFSPTLLQFLARQYSCGPQVSVLLEQGINQCASEKELLLYKRCLTHVYSTMNEKDTSASFIRSLSNQNLRDGMTLECYNQFQSAQLRYLEIFNDEAALKSLPMLHLTEAQERWKACTQKMGQWQLLASFAKLNSEYWYFVDFYYRTCQWK